MDFAMRYAPSAWRHAVFHQESLTLNMVQLFAKNVAKRNEKCLERNDYEPKGFSIDCDSGEIRQAENRTV